MFDFLKRNVQTTPEVAVDKPSDPDLLLRHLEWTTVRKLDGQLQGDFRTLFRGVGLMLADLREYQAHDDVRHIDWNVTARMCVPYVREHQEDREISVWFLVDLSGSIHFGSEKVTKSMLALNYVATLARLLTRHGNRVGAIIYEGPHSVHHAVIPPRTGRRQVLHLMSRMQQISPSQRPGETNLSDLFKFAQSVIKRRSTVLVVSDFLSTPGWEKPLRQLGHRHEVVVARLQDPSESDLPRAGMILVEDIETGEQIFVDSEDSSFRQRFSDQAKALEHKLFYSFQQAGVDCIELDTFESVDQSLLRFLRLRKRKNQMTRAKTSKNLSMHPLNNQAN